MRRAGSPLWRLWRCLSPALLETLLLLSKRGMCTAKLSRALGVHYNTARWRLGQLARCGLARAARLARCRVYSPTPEGAAVARAVAAWLEARGGEARGALRELWRCLSPASADVLLRLAAGPAAMSELARALGMRRALAARCLGRLARCGLARVVAREGRRRIYALTREGLELAAAAVMALGILRRQEAWAP